MIQKTDVFKILNREEEDIVEQTKEEVGRDYQGAVDFLETTPLCDAVGEQRRLIGEWSRVRNIYLHISNISE